MTLRTEVNVGDVFLNVNRFSMLRVKQVSSDGVWADYVSWRPDGTRGSNLGKVRVRALTLLPCSNSCLNRDGEWEHEHLGPRLARHYSRLAPDIA